MKPLRTIVSTALLSCAATAAAAATDGFDPHFGSGGVVLIGSSPMGDALQRAHGIAVDADGRILVATATDGVTVDVDPQPTLVPAIVRLNADGSWDETFGESGIYKFPGTATVSTYGGEARGVAVMSDGSILAAGETYKFLTVNDVHSCTLLFKIDADGTLDPTFGDGGSLCFDFAPEVPGTNFAHNASIAIGSGDLVYLTTPQTNLSLGAVARFLPNGVLDATYGSGGIASASGAPAFTMLALQADQRVVATDGTYTDRFTESGGLDPTFGAGGELVVDFDPPPTPYAPSAMFDRDGRLVSALDFGVGDLSLSRIDADGSLDATFNGTGEQPGFPGFATVPLQGYVPYLIAAAPVEDRIFAIGGLDFTDPNGSTLLLARFNGDASFDATYGDAAHPGWTGVRLDDGDSSYNDADGLTTDPAGRIFVVAFFYGDTVGRCNGIVRIIPDDLFNDGLDPPPARVCPP